MKVAVLSPSPAPADAVQARAMRAGAQFEAVLLNMAFGGLERSFAHMPGTQPDGVSKSYDGFGVEALTSGLASRGGIGLGAVIAKALMAQPKREPNGI